MPKLYDLTATYARLLASDAGETIDPVTGEVTLADDFAAALAAIEGSVADKLDGCAMVLRHLDADAEALEHEEKRLRARRNAVENNVERLRAYVLACMQQAEIKQMKTALFSFAVVAPRKRVEVTDPAALPAVYTVTKVEPNKALLKRELETGAVIEGATLVDGEPSLRVT